MYRGPNPNEDTAALHPNGESVDAWAVGDRTATAQLERRSDSEKYLMWDGTEPLPLQLPDNAAIRTLVTYAATSQNISIYAGAGVTNGPALLQTSGAAGTFRIPRGHNALTLVASAPFGQSIPIYICAVPLNPTVALQEVNVTINSGIPAGATFCFTSGVIAIAGAGVTQLTFTPPLPINAKLAVTFADLAFDAGIPPGDAIVLQQNVASNLKGLYRLVAGRNAGSYAPGIANILVIGSTNLQNLSIMVVGAVTGNLYYLVYGYFV